MPFLAAAIPAIGSALAGSAASAAIGAGVNAIGQALGPKASGYQPQRANIVNPLENQQMQQQQAAGNQLAQQLAQQGGIQNQQDVYGQYKNIAAGQGPNPAQAMLAQQTGANIQQQAALMAGQRGAGANAGLLARQAAQQGGALQQAAVGQGATMQAQQQLAALGQMSGLSTQQVAQQMQQQQFNQQQQLAAINAQNQANIEAQGQVTGAQTNMALQNAKAQQANTAGLAGGLGSAIQAGLTPKAPAPQPVLAGGLNYSGQNTASGNPIATTGAAVQGPMREGGGFAAGGMIGGQHGGDVALFAAGGPVFADSANQSAGMKENYKGPKSRLGQHLHSKKFAKGGHVPGKVDAMVSPGEVYLSPAKVREVIAGKRAPMQGEKIPGKPAVGGAKNSYANDTVHKKLQEGGIVLPRSVTQSGNAPEKAAAFVKAVLAKQGRK